MNRGELNGAPNLNGILCGLGYGVPNVELVADRCIAVVLQTWGMRPLSGLVNMG